MRLPAGNPSVWREDPDNDSRGDPEEEGQRAAVHVGSPSARASSASRAASQAASAASASGTGHSGVWTGGGSTWPAMSAPQAGQRSAWNMDGGHIPSRTMASTRPASAPAHRSWAEARERISTLHSYRAPTWPSPPDVHTVMRCLASSASTVASSMARMRASSMGRSRARSARASVSRLRSNGEPQRDQLPSSGPRMGDMTPTTTPWPARSRRCRPHATACCCRSRWPPAPGCRPHRSS